MEDADELLDLAIIGGGVAGVIALAYARRAGLKALILESQSRIGGLWRDLPAWQDIQISAADWALGDLPLQGSSSHRSWPTSRRGSRASGWQMRSG
jgi:cation diffusion facilitator CzcD-associated flavoprotein CzcO